MVPRNRRTVLKLAGLGVGGAGMGFATGLEQDGEASYSVVQGERCVPVTPIAGSEPVEEFYDWGASPEKRWSSNGTVALQREDTSVVFLYDGPDATSLVFVHGKLGGNGTGGAVSFSIDGLPPAGEWVVEDDNYDGPNNYDNWHHVATASQIDWTWDGSRTDGGVFRGVSAADTIRIVPRFNEVATHYGEYYQGDVERWEFLSGGLADPRRIQLAMGEPLVVGGIDCDGGDGSSGDSGQGDDGGNDKQDRKHQKKQEKHERKQRKHEEKRQKKHEKKQRKHEAKQKKHEAKQKKHEAKQKKHEVKEDDD